MKILLRVLTIMGIVCGMILFVFILLSLWPISDPTRLAPKLGVTFSRTYATQELGLDADAVLHEALDDLGIRRFRIPVYWKEVEQNMGQWDFQAVDRDLAEIRQRNGEVVLAIGQKLPRWPECWTPDWASQLSSDARHQKVLAYIETVVERYTHHPEVIGWQVENEAHFAYGICPPPDFDLIRAEMALVHRLDPRRPISTTESGELSAWTTFRHDVDRIGVSLYRVIKNRYIGITHYWMFTPQFYFRKAQAIHAIGGGPVYISELQMEPWATRALREEPLSDQLRIFPLQQMKETGAFARATHLSPIDLWGLEWWYWMKTTQNHPEYWEEAKDIFKQ